jgi:pectate lyase
LAARSGIVGFGAKTVGGKGGKVLDVTNLDDSGPGSLRAALEAGGRRSVRFLVSGTITLKDDITITEPFLTVDGSTAPGEGVQIRGGMLKIQTHDVILRYLKIRPGDMASSSNNESRDAVSLSGTTAEVSNVVIDHCSLVWGPDIGSLAILTNAHDITVQYSILGEGLYYSDHPEADRSGGHSKGLNITKLSDSYGGERPSRITLYHNLLTTADDRMPQVIGGENVDIVNNVIYNWGKAAGTGNPVSLNLIKNVFIRGPMTKQSAIWLPDTSDADPKLHTRAGYVEGNVAVGFTPKVDGSDELYRTIPVEPYSVDGHERDPREVYAEIVQSAGASLPVRDEVDQRIIANLEAREGEFLSSADLDWPELEKGAVDGAAVDSDTEALPEEEPDATKTTGVVGADDAAFDVDTGMRSASDPSKAEHPCYSEGADHDTRPAHRPTPQGTSRKRH